jgi:uncharacterized protein (DUF488 family)
LARQDEIPERQAVRGLFQEPEPVSLPAIHTIGYEGASVEGLISALQSAGISRLLDIRESPFSRRPEFSRDELGAALGRFGIAYEHIRELGNPPAGREAARVGHKAVYREILFAHLDGPEGQEGLERALALAARERVCLLCFEKSPGHCHRSMVIQRMEARSGQEIVHLKVAARQAHPAQGAFEF